MSKAIYKEESIEDLIKDTKSPGLVVETKFGIGFTKNQDAPVRGKIPVYLKDGRNVLCNLENIKHVGFHG